MSQQYPQQPQWGQPQQPQWGAPTQPVWGAPPPQPPKKTSVGKIIGLGCAGIIGLFVVIGIVGAMASSGSSKNSSSSKKSTTVTSQHSASASSGKAKAEGSSDNQSAKTVVFKVWGTAPAGDLGPLDITYGSDSDNLKGTFKNGSFTASLPLKKDAMFYQVNAQLQGSGDIHCSVTVDGHTKSGHASGGYNICDAQLSSGLFGGWG